MYPDNSWDSIFHHQSAVYNNNLIEKVSFSTKTQFRINIITLSMQWQIGDVRAVGSITDKGTSYFICGSIQHCTG